MQKIEASKLLNKILNDPLTKSTVILNDDDVFQKCVEDALLKQTQQKPRIFYGAQALTQYHAELRQNNLFEPPSNAIIVLDETFARSKNNIQTLHTAQNIVFLFGKTSLRHTITEKIFPNTELYVCYEPNDRDKQKCVEILFKYYLNSSNFSLTEISKLSEDVLMHYNQNLYQCALHFERMSKSGLNFEDAKFSSVAVSGFDVINTLLENNLELLDMRLQQHASSGEDVVQIFVALVYFFKQLAHVYAELETTSSIDAAMRNAKIPYPAQNNIKKAVSKIPYEKVEHFFSICAHLEIALRESKNGYQLLFLELSVLLDTKNI